MRDPRFGKMQQQLEDPDNSNDRCCLGHLCHAMNVPSELDNDGDPEYIFDGDSHSAYLPSGLAKALDMTTQGDFMRGIIVDGVVVMHMSGLNDDTDLTPAQIADVIEEQFEAGNIASF